MTLSHLQGHSPAASLSECYFSYSYATTGKNVSASRGGPSAVAQLSVKTLLNKRFGLHMPYKNMPHRVNV